MSSRSGTSASGATEARGTTSSGPTSSSEADRRRRRGLRLRQTLVVALAVVSGATDAIGLLTLGGAFTSVMTGNLVLLGVSASSADQVLAIAAGGAILAFCAGAALGARLAGSPEDGDRLWPRAVTFALTVEFLCFAAYAAGWWLTGASLGSPVALVLLSVTALALGIQSSTVQRFGISGMSTTYLTGTLTTVVIRLATGRGVREVWHSIEILLGLVAGAAAAGVLILVAPLHAPALQLIVLGGVIVVAATVAHRR